MSTEITSYTLTAPGPKVTRSINIEHVRNYLRAQGWTQRSARSDEAGFEIWGKNRGRYKIWLESSPRQASTIEHIVWLQGYENNISCGEVLMRMVDGTEGKNDAGAAHD